LVSRQNQVGWIFGVVEGTKVYLNTSSAFGNFKKFKMRSVFTRNHQARGRHRRLRAELESHSFFRMKADAPQSTQNAESADIYPRLL